MEKIKFALSKRKVALTLGVIIVVIGFLFLQNRQKNALEETVKSHRLVRDSIAETLILSGEIKAHEIATLKFQTGGRLAVLPIKQGDIVKKGQLVAALDQRDLQKRLKKELNDYLTTRWDFEQGKDDAKDKVITTALQRSLDQSQFTLDNSVLDVELQSIAIEYASIYAPVSGIVASVAPLQPGMNIAVTDTVLTVVNPDSLYFEIVADQTEVTQIVQDMSGMLKLDAYTDETIPITVKTIGFTPKAGESGTVYAVEIQLVNTSNGNHKYRLGMTGDVEFITKQKADALVVPLEYVEEDEKGKYVYLSNDKKTPHYIKTGLETESVTEVIDGLKEGDIVYD